MDSEAIKKLVQDYEQAAWNDHDIEKAASYLSSDFKQHNPYFADGIEGFKGGLKYMVDTNPNLSVEIKQMFVQDNYVITHIYAMLDSQAGTGKKAIMDIYRIKDENGPKIAEHWDVIEDIPEEPKNSNTMF